MRSHLKNDKRRGLSIHQTSKWLGDLLLVTALGCIGLSAMIHLPIGSALELGPDEGYEMMKGLLVSQGHALYGKFWNDQPPVYTEMLAILFRLFGPTAFVARSLNVVCSVLLLWSVYVIMAGRFNRICGIASLVYLALSDSFFNLSVAAMLELPAMAAGMASAAVAVTYCRKGLPIILWWSGALFAIALQVKLTSILLLPAIISVILMSQGIKCFPIIILQSRIGMRINAVVQWGIACVLVFSVIQVCYCSDDVLSVYWRAHVAGHIAAEAGERAGNVFSLRFLLLDNPLVLTAGCGILVASIYRERKMVFPAILLITAIVVHSFHRPYWWYYAIHISIPLALLSSYGSWKVATLLDSGAPTRSTIKWAKVLMSVVWSIVVSRTIVYACADAASEYKKIMSSESANSSPLVNFLKAGDRSVPWVYTDRVIYAFWARRPVPPEIAVMPWKRFVSHQISSDELIRCLKHYQPDRILLLETSSLIDGAQGYIDEEFDRYWKTPDAYVRRIR